MNLRSRILLCAILAVFKTSSVDAITIIPPCFCETKDDSLARQIQKIKASTIETSPNISSSFDGHWKVAIETCDEKLTDSVVTELINKGAPAFYGGYIEIEEGRYSNVIARAPGCSDTSKEKSPDMYCSGTLQTDGSVQFYQDGKVHFDGQIVVRTRSDHSSLGVNTKDLAWEKQKGALVLIYPPASDRAFCRGRTFRRYFILFQGS